MKEDFKATHKVVKLEQGAFVFSVGTLVQHIGNGFYKSEQGNRKYVPDEFLKAI